MKSYALGIQIRYQSLNNFFRKWKILKRHIRPKGLRRKWDNNITVDLQEVGCGDMGWIELAQCRDRWLALVNAVLNLLVP
jgi:hypothetical protein